MCDVKDRRGYRGMLAAKANAPVHNIDDDTMANIARLHANFVKRRRIAEIVNIRVELLYDWVDAGKQMIKRGNPNEEDNRVKLARIFDKKE